MDNIFEVEKLNCIKNEMTHLWGSACATAGGAVVLFLSNEANIFYYIIATAGILISIIMANAYFIRRNEIVKILRQLEEK